MGNGAKVVESFPHRAGPLRKGAGSEESEFTLEQEQVVVQAAGPFAALSRDQLPTYLRAYLRRGGGSRPALFVLERDGARVVVKDYRDSGWLMRALVGPWLVRREEYIYRLLQGSPGVPRLIGRVDRHALAVEHISGYDCDHYQHGELPDEFFSRLRTVVEAMHARGVVHCDMRNRRNIVVGPFTSRGFLGPVRRFFFERFRLDDLRGVAKAKCYCGTVTQQEERDFAFRMLPGERFARTFRDAVRWLFQTLTRR